MRRNDLDYARGIAILLILIGHSNGISNFETKLIYSFHVPLFFVISGMLMCHTNAAAKPWKQIMTGWLKRLIVPSIIWEMALSFFYFFIKDIPLKQLALNSITFRFNLSVLWFIPCLLLSETIWIAILKIRKKGFPVCMCGILAISFMMSSIFMPVVFMKRILIADVFVILGYALEAISCKNNSHHSAANLRMLSVFLIIWITTASLNIKADLSAGILGNEALYYLHSFAGSISVIWICKYLPNNLHLLGWIGKNTIGFLVTHVFVRYAIIAIEEMILGYFWDGWLLAIPMILIDTVAVWLIGRVVPEVFGQKRLTKGTK